jgi:hypothetical protein
LHDKNFERRHVIKKNIYKAIGKLGLKGNKEFVPNELKVGCLKQQGKEHTIIKRTNNN